MSQQPSAHAALACVAHLYYHVHTSTTSLGDIELSRYGYSAAKTYIMQRSSICDGLDLVDCLAISLTTNSQALVAVPRP